MDALPTYSSILTVDSIMAVRDCSEFSLITFSSQNEKNMEKR